MDMATSNEVITKLKAEVKSAFEEIRNAVNTREKTLLRQIDVIASQAHINSRLVEEIQFLPYEEIDILSCIRSFGKFNIDNLNLSSDLYINEDYICPTVDHETMYKCLDSGKDEVDGNLYDKPKEVCVNLCNNKPLVKKNIENINESIINITLREVQNLIEKSQINIPALQAIEKSDTPLNLLHTTPICTKDNEVQQTSKFSQTETDTKNLICKKPNITINNCNGTINLRNISNLTISCTNPDLGKTENLNSSSTSDPPAEQTQMLSYEESGEASSSNALNVLKDNENNSLNCEFYSRLIREIKNTLKKQTGNKKVSDSSSSPSARKSFNEECSNEASSTTTSSTETAINNESINRKMLLRNFENLKIVFENENETHPIQIEQWLAEIISATEVEPVQNTEILEHSQISTSDTY